MQLAPDKAPHALSILIIDDEDFNRANIASRLKDVSGWSLKIDTAATGTDALERLKGPPYDLIFLDNRLPDVTGLEILDRIRQLHPKSAVLMMTSAGNEQLAVAAMKKGAMDYMTQQTLSQLDFAHLFRRVIEMRYLVDQNMELRQVNQMKTEFIANVSHELRTPLAVIMGYAQTLKSGNLGPLTDGQVKAIDSILSRSHGLLETLNQILRVRDSHEGKQQVVLKPLELRAFLSEAAKATKEMTRKDISLECRTPAGEVWVKADRGQLSEVLDNVLSNAGKFGTERSIVRLALDARDGSAVLSVRDQGAGIPPEMLPKVFETFGAAGKGPTREHAGLGLGLALSRQIVEQHGGRIWLESTEGQGTTVFVSIPLSTKDAPGKVVEAPVQIEKQRILIVEDNPDIIDILELFLSTISKNLEVVTAHSGFEALDAIKNQLPHLMILDVMMPGMNGFEVIERLRKAPDTARIPILVLTGYSEAVSRARAAGAQDVLLKPFDKAVFTEKLMKLLKTSPAS